MRKKTGIFLMGCALILAFSFHSISDEKHSPPKLDCQEMALAYVKAFENLDYRSLAQLMGMEYSEEEESQFKQQFENPEMKAQLDSILEIMRLFPKIGEIPDWVTEVSLEYEYVEGNNLIEMHGEFVLSGDGWIIQDLEPRGGENLDEPAPSEGNKTFDAGLNELIAKLFSSVEEKSWDGVEETGAHPDDCGLHPSDPPEERERALKLLSQFPSIGPIPAPAKMFSLGLKGTLDSNEAGIEIVFRWVDNKLEIANVSFT